MAEFPDFAGSKKELQNILQSVRGDIIHCQESLRNTAANKDQVAPILAQAATPELLQKITALCDSWKVEADSFQEQLDIVDEVEKQLEAAATDGALGHIWDRINGLINRVEQRLRQSQEASREIELLISALIPTAEKMQNPMTEAERQQLIDEGTKLIAAIEERNKVVEQSEWALARIMQFPQG